MTVAVIDIGSNTIKSLAARRGSRGDIVPLTTRAIDARIGTGLGGHPPRLSEEDMQRGLEAIRELLADFGPLRPGRIVLAATSAVRDASNGAEFRARVREATGHDIRVLTGDEETNLIGRGLMSDPALADLRDFYAFDLGGGSLEGIVFRARRMESAASLPLGCVRLTEKCAPNPARLFGRDEEISVTGLVREILAKSSFQFSLPDGAEVVFTGGTVTTARVVFAKRLGRPLEDVSPVIAVTALRALLDEIGGLPLEQRKGVPGLHAARADIFPTALAIVLAVAEAGGFAVFRHSLHGLRHGLAAELLG